MDSVHAEGAGRVHIRLEVVEKCRARRSRTETFHREFVDSWIGLADAHFMAVDDGVKDRGKIHQWPPPFAKLEDVVGENADGNASVLQIMYERDHVVIQLKIEW